MTLVNESPLITIVDRRGTRKLWNFAKLVDMTRTRFPEANVSAIDLAQLTLRDQVRLAAETDILVGVHDAGLRHSLGLGPRAVMIEIKPQLFPGGLGYVAQLNGATYFEGRTMWPEEWNATFNGTLLTENWRLPKHNSAWQKHEYVYVSPADFLGLIEAGVRSLHHINWEVPPRGVCVSNGCHYDHDPEPES